MANPFAVATRAALTGPISVARPRAHVYHGAQINRLHADWVMSSLSANQALYTDLLTLRNRARELVISNATAARVPSLFSENIIGKDGITLQSNVRSTRGEPHERLNRQIDLQWYRWAERQHCSVDGSRSWCETEALIAQTEAVDGEVLIRLVRGFDNPFGFAIDVLDPDQLDETYNVEPREGQNAIVMGVEQDRWGRPVAYHLWANHPSELKRRKERIRVPADQIVHLFIQRRPKQGRGVTWFAPVIVDLKMLGGYREAELVAARTASAKMGFMVNTSPENPAAPMTPEDDRADHIQFNAEPGVVDQLEPGWDFKSWDPTHPSTAFAEFDKAILRSIATALRVSYMSLSGDLSDTSYGSGRIGLLNERAVFESLQYRFVERVSQPVFRAWLEMAALTGAVQLPSSEVDQYAAQAKWHPRPFPWIDPEADLSAAETELRLGLETHTRFAAKKGLDYELDILAERQRERQLRAKYGEPEPVLGTAAHQQPDDENEAETDDEDTSERPAAPRGRTKLLAIGGN